MLFSTTTDYLERKYGLEGAVKMLIDAGFPAIDIFMFDTKMSVFSEDYKATAKNILEIAKEKGVIFNQAHAPFGGPYEHYTEKLVPHFERAFEFASLVGVKTIVVHPVTKGAYLGREREHFEMNMEFYSSLIPLAKKTGVKIGIENMWGMHPVTKRIIDSVGSSPKELLLYYDTLNDPEAFTICLDIGHVAVCMREPEDAIRTLGDRIGAIHAHDVDYLHDSHTLPGVASLNWNNIARALADIDYKGEFTLEADNFYCGFDDELIPTVARFMADVARNISSKIDFYRNK